MKANCILKSVLFDVKLEDDVDKYSGNSKYSSHSGITGLLCCAFFTTIEVNIGKSW